MKKLAALLLSMLMMTSAALAEIEWPDSLSSGQSQLKAFVEAANEALASAGAGVIDMQYEMYSTFASLGMNGVEMPENPLASFTMPVEMYFVMQGDGLYSLQLRMQDVERFAAVAAACLYASSPTAVSLEQARAIADAYVSSVLSAPNVGFEEEVEPLQGPQPRAYFAYFPDQFHDQRNWIQMTLIFARPGSADAPILVPISTPAPEPTEDTVWLSQDNFTHLEIFVTPTPEPDSAAME
ncbi:MAG: hypothetical protein ACI4MG_07795 [Aristaeellaceae bacterium]